MHAKAKFAFSLKLLIWLYVTIVFNIVMFFQLSAGYVMNAFVSIIAGLPCLLFWYEAKTYDSTISELNQRNSTMFFSLALIFIGLYLVFEHMGNDATPFSILSGNCFIYALADMRH